MDPDTLRTAATLARGRAALARSPTLRDSLSDRRDGLERLGAARALEQLARDLDVTAAEFESDPGNP